MKNLAEFKMKKGLSVADYKPSPAVMGQIFRSLPVESLIDPFRQEP